MAKDLKPSAFMSYAHSDDRDGRLSVFRRSLQQEICMQTGTEFEIFQDSDDIGWGQDWKERIDGSLKEITFLLPIITPSFFKSKYCRDELKKFLEREAELKRNDLILPVYYISTPLLDDGEKRADDDLVLVVSRHQYADWREYRLEPHTSPGAAKMFAKLASHVVRAIDRIGADEGQA